LFIEDIHALIDTPEDIVEALNYNRIDQLDYVLYSHWDPDHTRGMRVFEQLRVDWLNVSIGIENDTPILVHALPQVCNDISAIKNKFGSNLEYYQKERNLIKLIPAESAVIIAGMQITFVPVILHEACATVFVFEQNDQKVLYAPCDVKPFPSNEIFANSDLLIIGNTVPVDIVKGGFHIKEDNPFKEELFTMKEIVALKEIYNVKKVIVTHLEEIWGLSYADYEEISKLYDGIGFAFDGMSIEL